jgi:serine/threonine protein kinase
MSEVNDTKESGAGPGSAAGDELEALLREELAPDLEVVRKLSLGSMAVVYLAREQQLKRLVAVKVLSPKLARDETARLRFEREAQAAASLSHPNIVAIYRVGRLSNDLPYFIMQYVKGRTMADRIKAKGGLPLDEARRAIGEVASAVAAAHQKGIVHRDIRPGNVLYEEDSGRSMLADFGIAAIVASGEMGGSARLTRTGELVGDPSYMSPEQLMGLEVTERSDVYAIGLLGYELVAGRGPFKASSKREKLTAHVKGEPAKLSDLRPGVDPAVESVLARCLAKEPEHRPDASDVASSLKDVSLELTPMPSSSGSGDAGFIGRAKERRMLQIVLAYGAMAVGASQLAWMLVESGTVQQVVFRLVLVSVVTGFPAVLVGAWFHGKKGRQKFESLEYWFFGGLAVVWLVVSALILFAWRG